MNVRLPYGEDTVPVDVPDNWINGRCYRPFRLEAAGDARAELLAALHEPVGADALKTVLSDRVSCAVAVDGSHPEALAEALPAFLEEIEDNSAIDSGSLRIVVANSIWDPLKPADLDRILPEYVRTSYQVELHDPTNNAANFEVGELRGGPLRVNKTFAKADYKVVFGVVGPDLITGFTGGRALVLPGLAHVESLRWLLGYENLDSPNVRFGNLRDNPVHQAAMEAAERLSVDLQVSILPTADGKLSRVIVGEPGQSFMAAVGKLREKMTVRLKEPMDIVVTSGGGAPYDSTLHRLVDTLSSAIPILKPDGTVVVTAEMLMGFGASPLREIILSSGGPRGFRDKYSKPQRFTPGQWIAQRYFSLLEDHEVIVFSEGVNEDDLWAAGMTPTKDVQEAIEVAMQGHGQRCKICALPDGPFTLAALQLEPAGVPAG